MQLCIAVTTITKFFGSNDQNPSGSTQLKKEPGEGHIFVLLHCKQKEK